MRIPLFLCGLAFLGVALVGGTLAQAGDLLPWPGEVFEGKPEAIAAAMDGLPNEDRQPNSYLLWDQRVEVFADHRTRTVVKRVYEIHSLDEIESRGTLTAAWIPWLQSRPTIRARAVTPDGVSHELDPTTVTESSGHNVRAQVFTDSRILSAPLPAVGIGTVIETEVIFEDRVPFCSQGVTGEFGWETLVYNRKRYLEVRAADSIDLRIAAIGNPISTKIAAQDGKKVWRFEKDSVKPLQILWNYLPSDATNVSHIVYSTGHHWRDIATHYHEMVEKQIEGTDLRSITAELRREGKGPVDRLQKACRWIADQIRFTGVEFGVSAIQPHKPMTTLTRRYGDCKDQAVLLVAMLRDLDIDANLALLCVQAHVDLSSESPGLNSFDHAVVYVPAKGPLAEMWIDLTSPFTSFGSLPLADQGRLALIVSPDTDGLKRTPRSSSADNRREEIYSYRLSTDEPSVATVESSATGYSATYMRSLFAGRSREQLIEELQEQASAKYGLTEVKSYQLTDPHDTRKDRFRIRYEFVADRIAVVDDGQMTVTLFPGAAFDYLPPEFVHPFDAADNFDDELPKRQHPYAIQNRFNFRTAYRIVPPRAFKVETLPEPEEFRVGPFKASLQCTEQDDGTIDLAVSLDTGDGVLTTEQVEDFRDEFLSFTGNRSPDNWSVSITFAYQPRQKLDDGLASDGIRQMIDLASQEPDALFHRTELSSALLTVGLGEEAREIASDLVAQATDSARAHSAVAWASMHDTLGRELRFGMNRELSLQSFRRAIELDGNDLLLKYNHAVTLEHDDMGDRYTNEKDLRKAAAIYKEITQSHLFDLAMQNYGASLLHLGETRELRKLAALNPDRFDTLAFHAASELSSNGLRAATKVLGRAATQDRTILLNTVASRIRGLRKYDLLREFIKANPELQVAPNLQILKRYEAVVLKDSEPESVLQSMLATWLRSGMDPQSIRHFYANAEDDNVFRQDVEAIPLFFQSVRDSVIENYGSLAVASDIVSFYEFSAVGDDASGYEVTATPKKELPGAPAVTRSVVKVGDSYKIFSYGRGGSQLGRQAVQLIDGGNLKLAANWIDLIYRYDKTQVGLFNPFSGTPFGRVWFLAKAEDSKTMRLAATLLAARGGNADEYLEKLTRVRSEFPALHQLQIDRVRISLLLQSRRFQELLDVANQVLESYPTANEALNAKLIAETKLGQLEEAETTLTKLARNDRNAANLGRRHLRFAKEGHAAVYEFDSKQASQPKASAFLHSLAAWRSLFVGKSEEAIELAKRAVELSPVGNQSSSLHTLASVYADAGQLQLAAATLKQSIAARNGLKDPIDEWVLGRIAEHCGLNEAARKYYQRVVPSLRDASLDASCCALAQMRLKTLSQPTHSP